MSPYRQSPLEAKVISLEKEVTDLELELIKQDKLINRLNGKIRAIRTAKRRREDWFSEKVLPILVLIAVISVGLTVMVMRWI